MRAKSLVLVLVAVVLLAGSTVLTVWLANKPAVGSNMGASLAGMGALAAGAALVVGVIATIRGENGQSLQIGSLAAAGAACACVALPLLGLASGNA